MYTNNNYGRCYLGDASMVRRPIRPMTHWSENLIVPTTHWSESVIGAKTHWPEDTLFRKSVRTAVFLEFLFAIGYASDGPD